MISIDLDYPTNFINAVEIERRFYITFTKKLLYCSKSKSIRFILFLFGILFFDVFINFDKMI